jgi:hypothetical protein
MGNREILDLGEVPDVDEAHVPGVDEVGDGGNQFSDFVLLGKYYLLKYLIMSLIIIINYSDHQLCSISSSLVLELFL